MLAAILAADGTPALKYLRGGGGAAALWLTVSLLPGHNENMPHDTKTFVLLSL